MRGKTRPAEIILEPDLSRCIETIAREEFRRGVQALAAGKGNEALAERSEIIRLSWRVLTSRNYEGAPSPTCWQGRGSDSPFLSNAMLSAGGWTALKRRPSADEQG